MNANRIKIVVAIFVVMTSMSSCSGALSTKALFSALQENAEISEIQKQLGRGADVNATDEQGVTPLQYAVSRNMNNAIKMALIEAGADVSKINGGSRTELLFNAIDSASPISITALIASGVDVNKSYELANKNHERWVPLNYALENSDEGSVITALIKAGASINDEKILQKVRNIETLNILIEAGVDVNAGKPLASLVGKETTTSEMVAALVKAGADVNLGNPLGNARNIDVLNTLIKAGANVNVGLPLNYLLMKPTTTGEMVNVMIEAGADVNLGYSLLDAACFSSDPSIITMLINAGADVRSPKDLLGKALKTYAVSNQNYTEEVLVALIHGGVDVNATFKASRPGEFVEKAWTPLSFAIIEQLGIKIINALIDAGADIGDGYLVLATEQDDFEVVRALLGAGANVNPKLPNASNLSPLQSAAKYSTNIEIFTALIQAGANVNENSRIVNTSMYGPQKRTVCTPLIFAAKGNKNPEVINILLDAGANPNVLFEEKNALDYAKKNQYLVNTPAIERLESVSQGRN